MARKRMVTRTIVSTQVTALCLDINKAEPCNATYELPYVVKDNATALKNLMKLYGNDIVRPVAVVDLKPVENCYGMPESEFLAHAIKLDPETRKALEAEEE